MQWTSSAIGHAVIIPPGTAPVSEKLPVATLSGHTPRLSTMRSHIYSFFASLAVHAMLFSALFAFASATSPRMERITVDISLVSLGGSGSGKPSGAGGGGSGQAERDSATTEAAAVPAQVSDNQRSSRTDESVPAETAAPEPQAPAEPSPPIAKEPQAVAKPARKPQKAAIKTQSERTTATKRTRQQRAPASAPQTSGDSKAGVAAKAAGPSGPGTPGDGPGETSGAHGKGGGNTGGSGAGTGGSGAGTAGGYIKANYGYIQRYIRRHLEYPRQARMMHQTGVAQYSFIIEKSGKISNVRMVKSSGFPLLDKAGIKAINDASPLPAPPEPARINMPISFTLQ